MKNVLFVALAAGCASPIHLTYDHGRAYTESVTKQADLTRPSVANDVYKLYGTEAETIRIQVRKSATDEETGEAQLEQSN